MNKAELVKMLVPGLSKETGSTEKDARSVLESYDNISALEKELVRQRKAGLIDGNAEVPNDPDIVKQVEKIRAEVRREYESNPERIRQRQQQELEANQQIRDYHLFQIFNTVISGKKAVRNAASEQIVIGWQNPGEPSINAEWFIRVLTEQPGLADQLQWRSAAVNQDEIDRDTFQKYAKLHRYAVNEANFGMLKLALNGAGFSQRDIDNAISTSQVSLAPATEQELEQWEAEAVVERQDFLKNRATTGQLRDAAREESIARQQAVQQEQADEALAAAQARDSAIGFPKLPDTWNGQPLNASFIRKCDIATHKLLMKRFGKSQLDAILQNRILAGQEN